MFAKDEIEKFSKNVVKQSKANLTRQGKRSSNKLYNSVSYDLKVHKNSFSLTFELGEYGQFVDEGVKGKNPSMVKGGIQKAPNSRFKFGTGTGRKGGLNRALDKWIVRKGLAPRNEKGEFMSRQSLRFLIARSIYAQGIKPSLFFTKAFENEYKKFGKDIIKAFGLDVESLMEFTTKK